jgi:hypothetical protein
MAYPLQKPYSWAAPSTPPDHVVTTAAPGKTIGSGLMCYNASQLHKGMDVEAKGHPTKGTTVEACDLSHFFGHIKHLKR